MKTPLLLSIVLSAPCVASAQQLMTPRTATAPRDGGVYHVATDTWTRRASQVSSLLGPDVLYANTCSSGYFGTLSGDTYIDEGRLPSASAPAPTGCATAYRVDGFTIAYCTDQTPATFGTYTIRFYQRYMECSSISGVTPTATIALTGLPASSALGLTSCWTTTIDLAGTGGGSFIMAADGDGSFGTPPDRFGWATTSTAGGFGTGPLIAGDPNTCAVGAGTVFTGAAGPGTGLGTMDQFRIQDGSTPAGCYFFGGNPFASFSLEIHGTACESFPVQTVFCTGDGSGTACPCGNNSQPAEQAGCYNTTTLGGKLRGFGTPSIAADSFALLGSNMPNGPCLYFQGTAQQNGGAGTAFGDGLRCVTGTLTRLGTQQQQGTGTSQYPGLFNPSISSVGGVTAPGTRFYQAWYRNTAPFCTPDGFNLTNGLAVSWGA